MELMQADIDRPVGKQSFALDPSFPHRLSQSTFHKAVIFIQLLLTNYSVSGLTVVSDREVAIHGLIERMRHSLATDVHFGILRCFMPRLLLWRRTNDDESEGIDYGSKTVPSWSWIAYPGGIEFMTHDKQILSVPKIEDLDFTLRPEELTVKLRQFNDCKLGKSASGLAKKVSSLFKSDKPDPKQVAITAKGKEVGTVWFDVLGKMELERCVIVGMNIDYERDHASRVYYVLVVREKGAGRYERVGVGSVEARFVDKEGEVTVLC